MYGVLHMYIYLHIQYMYMPGPIVITAYTWDYNMKSLAANALVL